MRGPRDLARTIAAYEPGSTVKVTVLRDGKEQDLSVTLGRLPTDQKLADKPKGADDGAAGTSLADLGLAVAPAADVENGAEGVAVVKVDPRGAAARRNLKVGDIILEVQGHAVSTAADVASAIKEARQDGRKSVLMRVRSGTEAGRFIAVPLATG